MINKTVFNDLMTNVHEISYEELNPSTITSKYSVYFVNRYLDKIARALLLTKYSIHDMFKAYNCPFFNSDEFINGGIFHEVLDDGKESTKDKRSAITKRLFLKTDNKDYARVYRDLRRAYFITQIANNNPNLPNDESMKTALLAAVRNVLISIKLVINNDLKPSYAHC